MKYFYIGSDFWLSKLLCKHAQPPVVDRESSVTPDKGGSVSDFDFGGVRHLDLFGLESPSPETPAGKVCADEVHVNLTD